jgi:hypothetical protein
MKRICHGATLNLVTGGNGVDVPRTGEALWSLRDQSWSPVLPTAQQDCSSRQFTMPLEAPLRSWDQCQAWNG